MGLYMTGRLTTVKRFFWRRCQFPGIIVIDPGPSARKNNGGRNMPLK
jgi:hypothetical protein